MTHREEIIKTSRTSPVDITEAKYRYDSFDSGECFIAKKTGRLPAMGWNSWNAFGSGNTEELTKCMADKIVELGLDELGYKYVVLDDGCYKSTRVDGKLANEEIKFPGGFRNLADYIHNKGLRFGMYNDIGTRLCAGSEVGTCGFEEDDAKSYVNWGVDFLKVDNCYYLWDNATFSNPENARFSYAPNIREIIIRGNGVNVTYRATDAQITGSRGRKLESYVTQIGTYDGTNVGRTPVGEQSSEIVFEIDAPSSGMYELVVEYATGKEEGVGQWIQVAIGEGSGARYYYDGLLGETVSSTDFEMSSPIEIELEKGKNILRLMNHRRQENVLISYAAMFNALQKAEPDNDIILSICEWGKTMPNNWGYKIGDSWRILNDITFQVGAPGDNGKASWTDSGTPSITSQYDKAVVMDEFAGLDKGWNDPDMMVIGMNGITRTMERTHMAMWCMMNSPLMLGLDLRRIEKGDELWTIIANRELISLNQDPLGIQAKRVYCSLEEEHPDKVYITNHDRVDILAKPLANGDIAVAFINLSDREVGTQAISIDRIISFIGYKMIEAQAWEQAGIFIVKNLWSDVEERVLSREISVQDIEAYGNVTLRISYEL